MKDQARAADFPGPPNDHESWPALQYEAHPWEPDEASASRTALRKHRGPYRASVPPTIADCTARLDTEILTDVDDATQAITRFDTSIGLFTEAEHPQLGPLNTMLLRTESASSSQIENLTVGARQIALRAIGHDPSRNARIVAANVRSMEAALDLADAQSIESILQMHEALMRDELPGDAGRFRRRQVWIGGSPIGPHHASFVPPHHDRIDDAMEDLVAFAARDDLPPLIHVALTHAQFETIHPFIDGNGRTGRALAHSMLRSTGLSRSVTVPVSAGLLTDTDSYFDALNAYRHGDITPIIAEFSRASRYASITGKRLVDDLSEVQKRQRAQIAARSDAAAWRLHDHLIGQPVIDTPYVSRTLNVSARAALNAIGTLVDAGVLHETTKKVRGRAWQSSEILDVLDEFAAQIRRVRGRR